MRKIIINADDYGLSEKFNKGILELAKKNIISSITVMIDKKHIKSSDLLNFRGISIGLHLELKERTSLREIEDQVKKFKNKFGKFPSHFDGHQHCHLTGGNLFKVIEIAQKYNLPVRSRFTEDREILKKHKIKTPDRFISWHPKRKEKLFKEIKEAEENIVELVCHPGYYDENCKYIYNEQREKELKILKSREFSEMIKRFKLVNYYEL